METLKETKSWTVEVKIFLIIIKGDNILTCQWFCIGDIIYKTVHVYGYDILFF